MIHFQHLATLVKIRVIGSGRGLLEGVGKKAKKERKKERKKGRKEEECQLQESAEESRA